MPGLASNLILGTAFIRKKPENISPKLSTVTPVESGPLAIINADENLSVITVESSGHSDLENSIKAQEPSWLVKSVKVPQMSETIIEVETRATGIHLVENHSNLIEHHLVLVARGIVDTVPGNPFAINVANCLDFYTQLSKEMKVAQFSPAPPM